MHTAKQAPDEVARDRRLIDLEDAARRLSVGRSTIYDLIGSGRLRSMKLGRRRLVDADSIDELIEDGGDE